MGCDIHFILEKKIAGKWVGVQTDYFCSGPARSRWYGFFAELGMPHRGESDTAEPLRGVPDDPSETARAILDYWSGDGHSHSWLTADQFIAAYKRAVEKYKTGTDRSQEMFGPYPLYTEEDDYRVIFFFDN
jgi:hypothetical protein